MRCARLSLIVCAVVGLTGRAHAFTGPKPGAASAGTLKLPDKPASIRGLSDAANVNVFAGQVDYALPIDLPDGPAGFGPEIALAYSGELGNGPLGVGWSVRSVAIRRSTRLGIPSFTDADELDLIGFEGGGGRLVPAPDFGPEMRRYYVEGQGKRIKVDQQGQRFEVTGPDGIRYLLGVTLVSREHDPGDATRVLAWNVERIINRAGQRIEYSYLRHGNQLYLQEIRWGFHGVTLTPAPGQLVPLDEPKYRAKLTYPPEARFDNVVSFRSGYQVTTSLRLQKVEVFSFGTLSKVYHVRYADDPGTPGAPRPPAPFTLSRIAGIEMHGIDDQGRLPPLSFDYIRPGNPEVVETTGVDGWVLNERGVNLMDVDGDGVVDLLRLEAGNHQWKKNLGGRFAPARPLSGAGNVDLEASRLIDLDGDARADLVHIVDDTWRWYKLVGEEWQAQGQWQGTLLVPLHSADSVMCDINGDGRTDVVTGSADAIDVRFGQAGGLAPPKRLPRISERDARVEPGVPEVRFVDANGDGLADVVWLTDQWMKVFLGRGDGTFVVWSRVSYPWGTSADDSNDTQLVDLDRDGLVDLVHVTAANALWYQGQANLTFSASGRHVQRPEAAAYDAVVTFGDVLGTGAQEIVWSSGRGLWALSLAGNGTQGMLSEIANGLGKKTLIRYTTSGLQAVGAYNRGEPWDSSLPVNTPVPSVVAVDPGAGQPLRSVVYGVRDGFWDGQERRFGGFLQGQQTTMGDTPLESMIEYTRFHPGLGDDRVLRGKVWYHRTDDGRGQTIHLDSHELKALPIDGLPSILSRRSGIVESRTFAYDGRTIPVQTRATFDFDREGRGIADHIQGRLDFGPGIPGPRDEREIFRTFNSDDATWVRDVVCTIDTFEGDGRGITVGLPVSQLRYVYGDHRGPAGSANDGCGVGNGWLLRTEGHVRQRWGQETDHWVTISERTYDALGNVIAEKEQGVRREIGYGQPSGSTIPAGFFPTSETTVPSANQPLTWSMKWDAALGVAIELTDPNGVVSTVGYDSLGRQTEISTGTSQKHHRYIYEWESVPPRTRTQMWDRDQSGVPTAVGGPDSGWRETVEYFNGVGEELYTATRQATNRWIISDWTERNARGLVSLTAEPFYWQSADPTISERPTSADFHSTTMTYDALARIAEQVFPNGAKKTTTYGAFEVSRASTDLATVHHVMDGLGRIVRTERTVSGLLEEAEATYDARDRLTSIDLQKGRARHTFEYDGLGRVVHAHDPDLGPRDIRYDDDGRILRHRNGANQTVGFFYDGASRLIAAGERGFDDPLTMGFVRQAQDFVYHYDFKEPGQPDRTNLKGRLAWVEEPPPENMQATGKVTFAYDQFGNLSFTKRLLAGAKAWQTESTSPSGLTLKQAAGDGFEIDATYDAAGRLVQLGDVWRVGTSGLSDAATALDAAGRVGLETFGNGLKQSYGRDVLGLPTVIRLQKPATPADVTLFGVNVVTRTKFGAPLQVEDLTTNSGLDQQATYLYDDAARLTGAFMGSSDRTRWEFRFRYDGLQNMTSRSQKGTKIEGIGILSGYYRYGEQNKGPRQLTSVLHKDCPGLMTTFDYDGAGRQTKDGDKTLTFDPYDRLIEVTKAGAHLATHGYGYDGLRSYTRSSSGTQLWFTPDHTLHAGERWHYIKVGSRLIARLTYGNSTTDEPPGGGMVMAQLLDPQGTLPASVPFVVVIGGAGLLLGWTTLARRRLVRTAPALAAVCGLILAPLGCAQVGPQKRAADQTAKRLFFHNGVAEGPVVITNNTQGVVEERRFDPFGHPIDALVSGTIGEVGFDATDAHNSLNKETNPQTGWSDHGARWMGPQTARWLSPDPPLQAPDDGLVAIPWQANPYAYGLQSPSLFWDPTGEEPVGHHYVPNSVTDRLVSDFGLSKAAQKVFRSTTTGWIAGVDNHVWNEAHKQYNPAVYDAFKKLQTRISAKTMTDAQSRAFLASLKRSSNPAIKQFIAVHEAVIKMGKAGKSVAEINKFYGPVKNLMLKKNFPGYGAKFAAAVKGFSRFAGRMMSFISFKDNVQEAIEIRDMEAKGYQMIWRPFQEKLWVPKEEWGSEIRKYQFELIYRMKKPDPM